MINRILISLIFLILASCGFSPIYNNAEKTNYNIIIVEKKGDNTINNRIISEMKRQVNPNSAVLYKVKINTEFNKVIISKDSKGSASNYKLSATSIFEIEYENEKKEIILSESQNIKKDSNIFNQRNYENNIKNNFATSIVNKINLKLINFR